MCYKCEAEGVFLCDHCSDQICLESEGSLDDDALPAVMVNEDFFLCSDCYEQWKDGVLAEEHEEIECPVCHGTCEVQDQCSMCHGRGFWVRSGPEIRNCGRCGGKGYVNKSCPLCSQTGVVETHPNATKGKDEGDS